MKKHIVPLLLIAGILLCVASCASFKDSTAGSKISDAVENARYYQCESGAWVTVIPVSENSVTVMYGKEPYPMIRAISASGVRYTGTSWEWWEKGDEASLKNTETDSVIDTCTRKTASAQ